MRLSVLATAAGLVAACAAKTQIHLCGDSTMARTSGSTQGWGEYLKYSFKSSEYTVVNHAIGGRSTRSYTREGRFDTVAGKVEKGDWVVIEFGHNDGGGLSNDNGRSVCGGAGGETCQTTYNGVQETVLTYPAYLKKAAKKMLDAGAGGVVLSSPTPNNVCETGSCSWTPHRFDYYAYLATNELGGASKKVYYVAHKAQAAEAMINLGVSTTNSGYPNDHTHTAPFMADIMHKTFALGLACGSPRSGLAAELRNSTSGMTSSFLGDCVPLSKALRGYI